MKSLRTQKWPSHEMLFLAMLIAYVAASGCGQPAASDPHKGQPAAMPVQVEIARAQAIPDATEYLAILKSRHSATINPQVEGQITKVFVKSGDQVKTGTPLLQIDPLKQQATVSGQEASRRAQEATVRYAQTQLERQRKLFEAGVLPKQDFDNAQSTYDNAVAQLKALNDQVTQQQVELRYYTVSAPMTGVVGDIPVRMGDRVTVSTVLTTVDEPGALEAYIYVPADRARDLKLGVPVQLVDDLQQKLGDTRITFISPEVDTDTQTVLAKATLENPQAGHLRVAQQVRARLIWGSHQGTTIPVLAVDRINGRVFAFLAVKQGNETVARQNVIQIGDTTGNNYEVLSGIQSGDHIILSGLQFLRDGAPVKEQMQTSKSETDSR